MYLNSIPGKKGGKLQRMKDINFSSNTFLFPSLRSLNFLDKKPLNQKCHIKMVQVVWNICKSVSKDRALVNITKGLSANLCTKLQ